MKHIIDKGWSSISDGSPEENEISFMWIVANVICIGLFLLVQIGGV